MILCCGEALIDMLPRKSDAGEDAFAPHAGGAVFNTAVALGRLGSRAGLFTGLSTDLFGDVLAGALAKSGVDISLAKRSDAPTTLAFVKLVNGQATYAFYDENTAGRLLSEADLPAVPDDVAALFFGGISLAVEPCAESYKSLMLREAPRRVTMIDPNIRPGFIKDIDRYKIRLNAMLAASDIVKMSDEDLHWLEGPGLLADLAHRILERGPSLVCITQGADGATGYTLDKAVFVPAERAEVVDTVGAGDTFNAGVLASLDAQNLLSKQAIGALTEDQITAALTLGVRSAAVTVSRAGANPPWAEELA